MSKNSQSIYQNVIIVICNVVSYYILLNSVVAIIGIEFHVNVRTAIFK